MYCDIPQCKRCCFCVPLRYGILIFGYLHLILTGLALTLTSFNFRNIDPERETKNVISMYHGLVLYYHAAIPITLYSIDIIFDLILIVGAHMKKDIILNIYFWYGMTTTVGTIIAFFALLEYNNTIFFEEFIVMFSGLVVHVYLIILIWWQMKKLYNGEKFHFINRTTTLQDMMESSKVNEAVEEIV